jgi:ABC-type amino acid transport substrate-binding protein
MATEIKELEGTWEEIMEHAEELAGKRVRVVVLTDEVEISQSTPKGTALEALLPFAGGWVGDDFEECLQAVYENRTQARFDRSL